MPTKVLVSLFFLKGDQEPEQEMHDINKPITLDDLTNPNKQFAFDFDD